MILTGFYGLQLTTHSTDVHAASTDARTATSTSDCVSDSSVGSTAWSNPGNAALADATEAVVQSSTATTSQYLKCTNFGFDSVVPTGSTINGIELTIRKSRTLYGDVKDNSVRLVKGGVIEPTDKASASTWPTSASDESYGGAADLWGGSWSRADIISSNFGAVISATLGAPFFGQTSAAVQYIQVTIYYSGPPVTLDQSGYRFFNNNDSTNVGSALSASNSPAVLSGANQAFRLRALAHVGVNPLYPGQDFQLEYVDPGVGSCAYPSGGVPANWTPVSSEKPGVNWSSIATTSPPTSTDQPRLTALNGKLYWFSNGQLHTSTNGSDWTSSNLPIAYSRTTLLTYDDKVWVLGGSYSSGGIQYSNDVYYTTDGSSFTLATSSANWSPRSGHEAVVFDNKMWIMGGISTGAFNDVWYSTDGVNWIEATSGAPWSSRRDFGAAVKDGSMWVMGGWNASSTLYNDVWKSTDGVNWTLVTGSADWSVRRGPALVVADDKFVILAGGINNNSNSGQSEVWISDDGENWDLATDDPGWTGRTYPAATVIDESIWMAGGLLNTGSNHNDLWQSQGASLIAFNDNPSPASGSPLTANASDPTHSSDAIVAQTYNEGAPIETSTQVPDGQDGMWDFSLIDNNAPEGTTYCLRMVYDDGTEFDSYSHYPTIITFGGELPTPQIQMHQRMRSGNWWNDGVRQLLHLD